MTEQLVHKDRQEMTEHKDQRGHKVLQGQLEQQEHLVLLVLLEFKDHKDRQGRLELMVQQERKDHKDRQDHRALKDLRARLVLVVERWMRRMTLGELD